MVEIEEKTQIPHSTVHRIMMEDLGLSKKSARWVTRLLTEDMKKKRIEASEVFLYYYGRDYGILLHPGDKRSLKAVASKGVSGSDKSKGSSLKKEANGVCPGNASSEPFQ